MDKHYIQRIKYIERPVLTNSHNFFTCIKMLFYSNTNSPMFSIAFCTFLSKSSCSCCLSSFAACLDSDTSFSRVSWRWLFSLSIWLSFPSSLWLRDSSWATLSWWSERMSSSSLFLRSNNYIIKHICTVLILIKLKIHMCTCNCQKIIHVLRLFIMYLNVHSEWRHLPENRAKS